jgi:hypothetical protein
VRVLATTRPRSEKVNVTYLAGFVHGTPTLHTGKAGSISTTPLSPLRTAPPAALAMRARTTRVVTRNFIPPFFP